MHHATVKLELQTRAGLVAATRMKANIVSNLVSPFSTKWFATAVKRRKARPVAAELLFIYILKKMASKFKRQIRRKRWSDSGAVYPPAYAKEIHQILIDPARHPAVSHFGRQVAALTRLNSTYTEIPHLKNVTAALVALWTAAIGSSETEDLIPDLTSGIGRIYVSTAIEIPGIIYGGQTSFKVTHVYFLTTEAPVMVNIVTFLSSEFISYVECLSPSK